MSDSHPVDVHVGKRLRLKRTLLGLSQEYIGNAIGVTFQQIQKYERGVNRMGASRLYDFSRVMSVPVSFFFEGYEAAASSPHGGMAENEASAFQHEQMPNRETMDMMRAYYRIKSPVMRKRVLELVKSMADADNSAT